MNRASTGIYKPPPAVVGANEIDPQFRRLRHYANFLTGIWDTAGFDHGTRRAANSFVGSLGAGRHGRGFLLDASGEEVAWGDHPNYIFTSDDTFTIWCLFRYDSDQAGTHNVIMGRRDSSNNAGRWVITHEVSSTDKIYFFYRSGSTRNLYWDISSELGDFVSGQVYNLLLMRTGTGDSWRLIINGIDFGTRDACSGCSTSFPSGTTTNALRLGKSGDSSGDAMQGLYLAAGIWKNYVFNDGEIKLIMRDPFGMFRPWRRATAPAAGPQVLSPTGITSAEAFGTLVIAPGQVASQPTGIASAEVFGTLTVSPSVGVTPTGVGSAEAFGSFTVVPGVVSVLPTGVPTGETFGTLLVAPGQVAVLPTGIASGEAFGTFSIIAAFSVSPTGIGSAEAFGTLVLVPSVAVTPTGLATGEAFGNLTIAQTQIVTPTGTASAEAFGTLVLVPSIVISPQGFDSGSAVGTPVIVPGTVAAIPTGVPTGESFGTFVIVPGQVIASPTGIVSGEAFGTLVVDLTTPVQAVNPSSIASGEAFGTLVLVPGTALVTPTGVPSAEAFGVFAVVDTAAPTTRNRLNLPFWLPRLNRLKE